MCVFPISKSTLAPLLAYSKYKYIFTTSNTFFTQKKWYGFSENILPRTRARKISQDFQEYAFTKSPIESYFKEHFHSTARWRDRRNLCNKSLGRFIEKSRKIFQKVSEDFPKNHGRFILIFRDFFLCLGHPLCSAVSTWYCCNRLNLYFGGEVVRNCCSFLDVEERKIGEGDESVVEEGKKRGRAEEKNLNV